MLDAITNGKAIAYRATAAFHDFDKSLSSTISPLSFNFLSITYLPEETNRNPTANIAKVRAHTLR